MSNSAKRSSYVDNMAKCIKNGYTDLSVDLLHNILRTVRNRDELNESQREYLIECLDRTIKMRDANKGFYLKIGRGKKKKATGLRDTMICAFMENYKDLPYEERLERIVQRVAEDFPDAPVDKKSVEAIYTEGQKNSFKFAEYADLK